MAHLLEDFLEEFDDVTGKGLSVVAGLQHVLANGVDQVQEGQFVVVRSLKNGEISINLQPYNFQRYLLQYSSSFNLQNSSEIV